MGSDGLIAAIRETKPTDGATSPSDIGGETFRHFLILALNFLRMPEERFSEVLEGSVPGAVLQSMREHYARRHPTIAVQARMP